MKLYDDLISKTENLINDKQVTSLPVLTSTNYPTSNKNEMVLRGDMAYELGGQHHYAVGMTLISETITQVYDEIQLVGNDLKDIKKDGHYARISILKVKEGILGEGENLYNAIKAIDYVKYHINPKGYMMRASAINKRETVRVSKDALNHNLDLSIVGSMLIDGYKKNKMIENVKIIFINTDDFDYKQLEAFNKHANTITKTIDHMLNNVLMDCHSCNLQEVCDEVEGLKELHFGLDNQQSH